MLTYQKFCQVSSTLPYLQASCQYIIPSLVTAFNTHNEVVPKQSVVKLKSVPLVLENLSVHHHCCYKVTQMDHAVISYKEPPLSHTISWSSHKMFSFHLDSAPISHYHLLWCVTSVSSNGVIRGLLSTLKLCSSFRSTNKTSYSYKTDKTVVSKILTFRF